MLCYDTIVTVFPDDNGVPQDFETWNDAREYAKWYYENYGITCKIEQVI